MRKAADDDPEIIELTDPPVCVRLRRTRSARRLSLSVSAIDGRAQLTLPNHCARSDAENFIREHRSWLRHAVEQAPSPQPIGVDDEIPVRGQLLRVRATPGCRAARISLSHGEITAAAEPNLAGAQIEAALRELARVHLKARALIHANALKAMFSRVTIRDTRSRWGSCSSNGALSFSWRLIMAPDDVLDYVAAHEVAHLREMNHSPRFWALVEEIRPDWRRQRDWLKRYGADLHRIRLTRRN